MIDPGEIQVVAVKPAQWPDACLGLPADGEICAMMITPGYEVTLAVASDLYVFRTNATGEQIRVATAPAPSTGDPLLTWRDSQSFNTLIIGTQKVASGRRGRPLISAPLAVPSRAVELADYLAQFAPFQAQTPAGEIALRGVGTTRASETEQRMLAEWARLVSHEARNGTSDATLENAISWSRRGGIAGFCDSLTIGRTGIASFYDCRTRSDDQLVARVVLPAGELARLYGWLDRFEPFAWKSADDAAADSLSVSLVLNGSGVEVFGDAERVQLIDWLSQIAADLRGRQAPPVGVANGTTR